jgi:hypothetical protein
MGWILGTLQEEFKHHHTLHINLEQMTGPTVRQTIQGADGTMLKAAMDDLQLPLGMNTNDQLSSLAEYLKNKCHSNSIDFLRMKVKPGTFRIRHESGFSKANDEVPVMATFESILTKSSGLPP